MTSGRQQGWMRSGCQRCSLVPRSCRGKVNPVMAEMLNMVAFHVIGSDLAVAFAAQAGQLS